MTFSLNVNKCTRKEAYNRIECIFNSLSIIELFLIVSSWYIRKMSQHGYIVAKHSDNAILIHDHV